MKNILNKKRAFTLIELIIVVSIIAVLSSLAYMSLVGEPGRARDVRRKADLKILEDSISMSNAQNRPIIKVDAITTGTEKITTNIGDIRVLRNAQMFKIVAGFIDSTILGTVSRDPKGHPYFGAFINNNLFQLAGALENTSTRIPETIIKGAFKEGALVDNVLSAIDNGDEIFKVGYSDQFIRGDIIQIDSEKMKVKDISKKINSNMIIVERGYDGSTATVHSDRSPIKIISFPSNASSLFCVGDLITLTKTADNASGVISNNDNIPEGSNITLTDVLLDNTYTCSASGDVKDGQTVVLYDVISY